MSVKGKSCLLIKKNKFYIEKIFVNLIIFLSFDLLSILKKFS